MGHEDIGGVGDHLPQRFGVGHHTRHDFAGLPLPEESDGHGLQMLVQLRPDPQHYLPTAVIPNPSCLSNPGSYITCYIL